MQGSKFIRSKEKYFYRSDCHNSLASRFALLGHTFVLRGQARVDAFACVRYTSPPSSKSKPTLQYNLIYELHLARFKYRENSDSRHRPSFTFGRAILSRDRVTVATYCKIPYQGEYFRGRPGRPFAPYY